MPSSKKLNIQTKIKRVLVKIKSLILGKTKKQTSGTKNNFLGKKMFGIFGFFVIYSFIFFLLTQGVLEVDSFGYNVLNFICAGDPYHFGIALTLVFLELSLLLCNEKILEWVFTKFLVLKHSLLLIGLTAANFVLVIYWLPPSVDIYAFLLILAFIWLLFQSIRIYSSARNGATKLEIKLSDRYSPILYGIAWIVPIIILGILLFVSFAFRFGVVVYTLDFIAVFLPEEAFLLYSWQMTQIMPMLYSGLMLVALFVLVQRILSRRRGSTNRAGIFDNLTFAIISFIMFLYAIYNIALYLFLDPEFLEAVRVVLHSDSQSGGFVFAIEFLVTIVFLAWIILDLRKQFDKGFMFFTQDGLIMLLLGTVIAQIVSRFGLVTGDADVGSGLVNFIKYDYIVLPWLILGFLGFTIIFYWIKPQEMGLFMHQNKAAMDESNRTMETILIFFKREFIRRGEKFLISQQMIQSIQHLTGVDNKGSVMSLIKRLDKQYVDVHLLEEATAEKGRKNLYFDFLPITTRYQKGPDAEKRARKYLQNQFSTAVSQKQRKRSKLTTKKTPKSSSKQSDNFIQALSVQYGRKIRDEAARQKSEEEEAIIIDAAVDENTELLVYSMVKHEYLRRIKQRSDYPEEFRFHVSEILDAVEKATKLTSGHLFPLLTQIAEEDWNFTLSTPLSASTFKGDKLIEFVPINDVEVYLALQEYRPEGLRKIRALMQSWFKQAIYHKRTRMVRLPPLKYKDKDQEFQRSSASKWWAQSLKYFATHFNQYQKFSQYSSKQAILKKVIENISSSETNEQE